MKGAAISSREVLARAVLVCVVALVLVAGLVCVIDAPSPMRGAGYTINAPVTDSDLAKFDRQIATVSGAGGKWVRFGASYYKVVQSLGPGSELTFDEDVLSVMDRALDKADNAGLNVAFITADGWADDSSREAYRKVMSTYWGELADRFADRVDIWQVYNEPNGRDYVSWDAEVPIDDAYLRKLASDIGLARAVIRQRNSAVLVTTNSMGYPMDDAVYAEWQRVFDILGDSVDAIAVSTYPRFDEAVIAELPGELNDLGDSFGKPVIVAEVGLQTCDTCEVTEAEQGTYVAKTVDSIASADVLATFVYELQDSGTDGEGTFGTLRKDGTPKDGSEKIFDAIENY